MASKYLQLFPIPDSLPHVVRDLTREILRYQPQDIIQFCAGYFKAKKNNTEFVWTEANPRAPRPSDYKKQQKNNSKSSDPIPAPKVAKAEKLPPAPKPSHNDRKPEPPPKSHESQRADTSNLTETSGIASLPDNHEDAASMYVDNLLESVQKHIQASS